MNFTGVIIQESLADTSLLARLHIASSEVEVVTPEHKTPWVSQWTLHTVSVPDEEADSVALELMNALDKEHNWYADFKNDEKHYVIFNDKVFVINRSQPEQYEAATRHGIGLGIPAYQVDFSPAIEEWKRPC